jgi:hypothetical protein
MLCPTELAGCVHGVEVRLPRRLEDEILRKGEKQWDILKSRALFNGLCRDSGVRNHSAQRMMFHHSFLLTNASGHVPDWRFAIL